MSEVTIVHCPTEQDASALLAFWEANGYKWCDGELLNPDHTEWGEAGTDMCYMIDDCGVSFADRECFFYLHKSMPDQYPAVVSFNEYMQTIKPARIMICPASRDCTSRECAHRWTHFESSECHEPVPVDCPCPPNCTAAVTDFMPAEGDWQKAKRDFDRVLR